MFDFKNSNSKVFKDQQLQDQLDREGFVIIPFYTPDEIERLRKFYYDITSENKEGFQPTTYFIDIDYRIKASKEIRSVGVPHIEEYMENFKVFMGSYIVKHADHNSELGVHQDMTLVDESKFMGINIWAPLCDTNDRNGVLHLIPGSHRLFPTYRNHNIGNIYDDYHKEIKEYMQPMYMKAGQAIVFDNSIVHYSPINRSKDDRIATNIFVTHKDATITICYQDNEKGQIELFEQEDTFFTEYQQFGDAGSELRPQIGKSIGFKDFEVPVLTPQLLLEKYGKPRSRNWLAKLKEMWS